MLRSVLATLDVLCLPDVSVSKMKSCVLSRVCHVENGKIHVRLLMTVNWRHCIIWPRHSESFDCLKRCYFFTTDTLYSTSCNMCQLLETIDEETYKIFQNALNLTHVHNLLRGYEAKWRKGATRMSWRRYMRLSNDLQVQITLGFKNSRIYDRAIIIQHSSNAILFSTVKCCMYQQIAQM